MILESGLRCTLYSNRIDGNMNDGLWRKPFDWRRGALDFVSQRNREHMNPAIGIVISDWIH